MPKNEEVISLSSTVIVSMQQSVQIPKALLPSCPHCGESVRIIQNGPGLPFYKCDHCANSGDMRARERLQSPSR